jgi:hypothetical protein
MIMKKANVFAGLVAVSLPYAVSPGATVSWNADVPVGATWNDKANWDTRIPMDADTASFTADQANTYTVNVSERARAEGLSFKQSYTFEGSGSFDLRGNNEKGNNFVHNQTGVTTTFNIPVSVCQSGPTAGSFASFVSVAGGKTILNKALKSTGTAGAVNLVRDVELNGDIDVATRLRMNTGAGNNQVVTVGGQGSTRSALYWILTGDLKLYLNRTGAYATDDKLMYVEQARVYLGADNAVEAGTNVRFKTAGYGLIAKGFNQDFGWLDADADVVLDMGGSDSVWTFQDSSFAATVWGASSVKIINLGDSIIRFAIDSANGGTGLSDSQIRKINLNGKTLSRDDVREDGGFLYITQSRIIS